MLRTVTRIVLPLFIGLGVAVVGTVLFVWIPANAAELAGIVLVSLLTAGGLWIGRSIAASLAPRADVAEVAIEGPITRGEGRLVPRTPGGVPVAETVEQIEQADAADHIQALLVRLNTPGGEIVPSDDLRRAVAAFDGPTIAYATDRCASGGYWIAAGCDELWARQLSLIGSIGVIGSQINASELADRLGVSYERFVAGEYKDAGTPLRELEDNDREYLQERVDAFYDQFVDRVAEGRDLDADAIRDTEARVYTGEEAIDLGLVDDLGTRDDVKTAVADRLNRSTVTVTQFRPTRGVADRFRGGAVSIAHAVGAGLGARLTDPDITNWFRLR